MMLIRYTLYLDRDEMAKELDELIETVNSPDVPVFPVRFLSLDGGYADFAMTDMELLIVDSELYGVAGALPHIGEYIGPVAGGSERWQR